MVTVDPPPGQHQIEPIALFQIVHGAQTGQEPVGAQMQAQVRPPRSPYFQAAAEGLGLSAAAWLQLRPQAHGPVQDDGGADELGPARPRVIAEVCPGAQGQRVGDPDQAGRAAQLGHQHGGVGLVELARLQQVFQREREVPAPRVVQQTAHQRFAVEARQAQPRDRTVQADQRRGLPVSDEAEVLQRQIAPVLAADGAKGWIGINHC